MQILYKCIDFEASILFERGPNLFFKYFFLEFGITPFDLFMVIFQGQSFFER